MFVISLKNLIDDYIRENSIKPYSIGFTLVFDENETPEVLVGISSEEEVAKWKSEHKENTKYYVWNTAEYEHFDIEVLQVLKFFSIYKKSRKDYLSEINSVIRNLDMEFRKDGKKIYIFSNDVDDDDFLDFLNKSLSKENLGFLKSEGLL
ncbi:hypothetical protein VIBNISFn27_890036 [Vibrio nigripulchritudo SFn27]|uniref:Uncharacterized protein n=1 Tax=Vibrio nigripulchritudo TaxID=28173 RepID=U4KBH3_9VIBR|nr:hypothetical protein [Vibrio nigripulchritudo]CCN84314.1 hypothetical protein VIBNIBLFn1_700010 [Vibrio nigripulchritudo BLFn1]CCN91166.1 hypothetical protein VIBNISFn27_890036 [Vibrio nigripulchritudo SFn27]CCN94922.1 hypothetical protein VIBNIENn2_460035 [Vibrio nigripulchritudo ENn2]CCO40006.1 hypothetical protein VIBNISFn135_210010 [Vibrio nigripulchritudo SFn135]CCO55495.1 hypothetical protein VIBNIWn13_850009 [Vibrio nigripulchritudo Wn13]